MLTIAPRPRGSIARRLGLAGQEHPGQVDVDDASATAPAPSSSAGAALAMPALFTATVSGPSSRSVRRPPRPGRRRSVTSPAAAMRAAAEAGDPRPPSSRPAPGRSKQATSAPGPPRPRAIARPMPLPAPVNDRRVRISPSVEGRQVGASSIGVQCSEDTGKRIAVAQSTSPAPSPRRRLASPRSRMPRCGRGPGPALGATGRAPLRGRS